MKYAKFTLALICTAAIFYVLNTKLGSIPPIGKFLDPAHGIWQNEISESSNDETIIITGLKAPVSVSYDKNLIPHIFAQNDADLYRAQGYITAKNRLWQLEFQTFAAAGRLSEIVGQDALEYDRAQRRKGMVFGAENNLKTMRETAGTIELLEAYRDGVNSYINSLDPKDYPVEYKLLDYKPEQWTVEKTALLLMYMTDMLAGGDVDLEYTNFLKKYGRERFDLLYPDFFDVIDPVIPKERDWSDWEVTVPEVPEGSLPENYITETIPKPDPDNGSNNWAVGPEKSYSGNPILANDPHLGLNLPSIWYAMQLATPEKNTFGVTLPGAMGIIIGFNNDISWGVTNATRDVRDWYKIDFQDEQKSNYRYANKWKATTKRIEEIKIREKETFYDTVAYTHHGPVTYDASFKGNGEQIGYAMKWAGHIGSNTQQTFLDLNKAKNYEDYVNALKHYVAPAQNFIFSSTKGDIALWIQGKFPNKWEGQGKFLMDGSNPANDWQGFIPQEHNAHIKNPERGFVSSANQHPVDETYPYYVFNDFYQEYRNRVINDFFRSKDKFDIQDFKDLHSNNYNLVAAELLPTMIDSMNTAELSSHELEVLEEVKNWNYYSDKEKLAPIIWQLWWNEMDPTLWDEIKNDSLTLRFPSTYQTIYLLKNNPDNEFMDIKETEKIENAKDIFLITFKEAVSKLDKWESTHDEYTWAAFKDTKVSHLLQGLPAFSRSHIPIGGYRDIVNATSETHGPSWRMIVEMSSPPKALGIYPGGQSGNPGSKYYDNFIDRWAAGEYLELEFLQDASQTENMLYTQTLNPAK